MSAVAIDGRRRRRGRCCRPGNSIRRLLLQEIHNEVLVVFYEVVGQALLREEVSKVVSPERIIGFQSSKLGAWLVEAIHASRRRFAMQWWGRRHGTALRRLWRRGSRGVPMSSKDASE